MKVKYHLYYRTKIDICITVLGLVFVLPYWYCEVNFFAIANECYYFIITVVDVCKF